MEKIVGFMILGIALLALAFAALTYKRSTYFDATTRVNLQEVIQGAENMEKTRLVELTKRLALISDSDFSILNILSAQFRRAILILAFSLLVVMAFSIFLLWKLNAAKR